MSMRKSRRSSNVKRWKSVYRGIWFFNDDPAFRRIFIFGKPYLDHRFPRTPHSNARFDVYNSRIALGTRVVMHIMKWSQKRHDEAVIIILLKYVFLFNADDGTITRRETGTSLVKNIFLVWFFFISHDPKEHFYGKGLRGFEWFGAVRFFVRDFRRHEHARKNKNRKR